jgi:hypothetical protein
MTELSSRTIWIVTMSIVIIMVVAAVTYFYVNNLLNASPPSTPTPSPSSSQTPPFLTDLNWGGYAVASDFNNPQPVVTEVTGSWVVPQVEVSQNDTFSAVWVGIGGTFGSTLIQTGTEQDCVGGTVYYSAWFEFLPSDSVTIQTIDVSPGDSVEASINLVDSNANQWLISIADLSSGQNFSQTLFYNSSRLSAEWTVERPGVDNALSSLANFGSVTMSNCMATVNGSLGNISDFSYVQNLMTNRHRTPLVEVSNVSDNGSSFTVKYLQPQ